MIIYTYGTKKLWDFNFAADLQEFSKIQIYVDMYVIEDILKTSTHDGNEVVRAYHAYDVWKEGMVILRFIV